MTSAGPATGGGHGRGGVPADLSSVFGAPAAALSRRRLRPRRRRAREPGQRAPAVGERTAVAPEPAGPESPEDHVTEGDVTEDDVDDVVDAKDRRQPAVGQVSPAKPRPPARRADAGAPRRRSGVVQVRDRGHVDLLLLAAASTGPAYGPEFVELVRERSDGRFVLPLRTVMHQLHRLTRNRLMLTAGNGGARRYSLTPLGERVLASRRREWAAFSHGLDGVLDAADGLQRGHGAGGGRVERGRTAT